MAEGTHSGYQTISGSGLPTEQSVSPPPILWLKVQLSLFLTFTVLYPDGKRGTPGQWKGEREPKAAAAPLCDSGVL